jgi:hypothetical protein
VKKKLYIAHNFWGILEIMDYKNIIYFIAPSKKLHPLGLFQNKHSKEFQPNFMANFNNI